MPAPPKVAGYSRGTSTEAGMAQQVAGPMGADPQALAREIEATEKDLQKVPDASSRKALSDHLADLRSTQTRLNVGGMVQQAQPQMDPGQLLQIAGGLMNKNRGEGLASIGKALEPKFQTPGSVDMRTGIAVPDQKLALEERKFGFDSGLKMKEDSRQDAELELRRQQTAAEAARQNAQASKTTQDIVQEKAKAYQAVQNVDATMTRLKNTAEELIKHPGLNQITGRVASMIDPRLISNDAMDAKATLDHLKAQVFIQGTLALRQASPTGAGVGNQSDQEGNKLQAAIAMVERAQTYEQLKTALEKVSALADNTKTTMNQAYKTGFGEPPEQPKTQAAPSGAPMSLDDYIKSKKK